MMNEEAKTVAVQATDAQALATIEAARIGAEATINAGEMTLIGGLVATLAAAGVAIIVGRKQADIQKRLANIEATKVRLELVERRAAFIDAVRYAHRAVLSVHYSVIEELTQFQSHADDLREASERLDKEFITSPYIFGSGADIAAIMKLVPQVSNQLYSLAEKVEDKLKNPDEVDLESAVDGQIRMPALLMMHCQRTLIPLTKPDLEALTSIEAKKPEKWWHKGLWSFFRRHVNRNKQKAFQ